MVEIRNQWDLISYVHTSYTIINPNLKLHTPTHITCGIFPHLRSIPYCLEPSRMTKCNPVSRFSRKIQKTSIQKSNDPLGGNPNSLINLKFKPYLILKKTFSTKPCVLHDVDPTYFSRLSYPQSYDLHVFFILKRLLKIYEYILLNELGWDGQSTKTQIIDCSVGRYQTWQSNKSEKGHSSKSIWIQFKEEVMSIAGKNVLICIWQNAKKIQEKKTFEMDET